MIPPLWARLEVAQPSLAAASRAFWSAPDLRDRYPGYLVTMHGVLRATVDLLELGATWCGRFPHDPVAAPLREYLTVHAEAERGHDRWLLQDLAVTDTATGVGPEAPDRLPSPQVARLVGAQYYWIRHFHPVTLLGYIAVLEGNPPGPELADAIMARTGLPASAFRTIRRHADLDPGHRDELAALLARLPLTAGHESAIAVSALHTAAAATAILTSLRSVPHA